MNKTKKATHNSKNYNRKRGQKVEVKGVFEHYIDDTKIILKSARAMFCYSGSLY